MGGVSYIVEEVSVGGSEHGLGKQGSVQLHAAEIDAGRDD